MIQASAPVRSCRAVRPATAVSLALLLVACGDGTGPGRGTPGLEVTAGAGVTDTVDALPVQALVVTVRGADGRPVRGAVVRFAPAVATHAGSWQPATMLVASLTSPDWSWLVADSTDAGGQASALVRMGQVAGEGGVVVSVPELGYQETARYTILPGAPTLVTLAPRDTAVFVAGGYTLRGELTDRYGNVRPEAPALASSAPEVTVDASGRVEGSAAARASIVATYGSRADTAWVSVVPRGSLVGTAGGRILFVNLDGTKARTVESSVGPDMYRMQWLPGDEEFSMLLSGSSAYRNNGYRVDQSGNATPLIPDAVLDTIGALNDFRVAPDGRSAVFSATCEFGARSVWMDLSTRALKPLSPGGGACQSPSDQDPSPSPDGSRVVVFSRSYPESYVGPLAVIDVATGGRTPLGLQGGFPVWSPTGERIAYWRNDLVYVANADGSGERLLTPPGTAYAPLLAWSPDGRWVLARPDFPRYLQMIRAEDGLILPLPFTVDQEPGMRSEVF